MTFSLLDIVQLLAAYHCAGLTLVLVTRPQLASLAILTAAFSAHMAANLGVSIGIIPPALDITSAFGLIYGPAFYLFVRGLVKEERVGLPHLLPHFIPAAIIAIWQPEPPIPYIFGLPSLVIYIVLALRALRSHKRLSAELRSDAQAISLRWVENALIAFAVLAVLDIGREIIGFTSRAIPDDLALAFVISCVTGLLTAMMLAARQHDQRAGALPDIELAPQSEGEDPRYAEAFERIGTLLEQEQAWREPRLSLSDLAQRLQLNPRDVSRAINLHGETSFARFINTYRIEALNALMADKANHARTIMELAYEVGFNSKSAFNRTYREMTGRTPTEAFEQARSG